MPLLCVVFSTGAHTTSRHPADFVRRKNLVPTAKTTPQVTATERTRVDFGKIPQAMELPNLISVQKESFKRFMGEGLREAFKESSPIQSQNHMLEVTFGEHQFGDPSHTVEECREKDMTYQAPLLTEVRLTNKETGEIKEQLVFMGDFPMMTEQGTFIINGTERIVVSQLVRSPGVYYSTEMDGGKQVYKAQIIPARGAWLEFEVDKRDQLVVSIDRKRKQSCHHVPARVGHCRHQRRHHFALGRL